MYFDLLGQKKRHLQNPMVSTRDVTNLKNKEASHWHTKTLYLKFHIKHRILIALTCPKIRQTSQYTVGYGESVHQGLNGRVIPLLHRWILLHLSDSPNCDQGRCDPLPLLEHTCQLVAMLMSFGDRSHFLKPEGHTTLTALI